MQRRETCPSSAPRPHFRKPNEVTKWWETSRTLGSSKSSARIAQRRGWTTQPNQAVRRCPKWWDTLTPKQSFRISQGNTTGLWSFSWYQCPWSHQRIKKKKKKSLRDGGRSCTENPQFTLQRPDRPKLRASLQLLPRGNEARCWGTAYRLRGRCLFSQGTCPRTKEMVLREAKQAADCPGKPASGQQLGLGTKAAETAEDPEHL